MGLDSVGPQFLGLRYRNEVEIIKQRIGMVLTPTQIILPQCSESCFATTCSE